MSDDVVYLSPHHSQQKVVCDRCSAALWYKGGPFINDGKWCANCAEWNLSRNIPYSFDADKKEWVSRPAEESK